MKYKKSLFAGLLLALISASASAFIVQDRDGNYLDCHYDRFGNVHCVPLDYQPPLDP